MSAISLPPSSTALQLQQPTQPADPEPTWGDFQPLVERCAALIRLDYDEERAKELGVWFSAPRQDDGTQAMFCDGSGSERIPAAVARTRSAGSMSSIPFQNRKWTSSGVAFKTHSTDTSWKLMGFPTPEIWSTTNAELDGFSRACGLSKDCLARNPAIRKFVFFSDAQNVLEVIRDMPSKRCLPNWDLCLLLRVMQALFRLADRPGVELELRWTPGHKDVVGNEKADQAARVVRPDILHPARHTTVGTQILNPAKRSGPASDYLGRRKAGREKKRIK